MSEGEEETGYASYMYTGDREINIYNSETSDLIGSMKKFGQVSFSRILENGSKHVILCDEVEVD